MEAEKSASRRANTKEISYTAAMLVYFWQTYFMDEVALRPMALTGSSVSGLQRSLCSKR